MTYQAQLDLFSLGTIEIDVMTLSLPNICQWMGGRVSMQCKKECALALSKSSEPGLSGGLCLHQLP